MRVSICIPDSVLVWSQSGKWTSIDEVKGRYGSHRNISGKAKAKRIIRRMLEKEGFAEVEILFRTNSGWISETLSLGGTK